MNKEEEQEKSQLTKHQVLASNIASLPDGYRIMMVIVAPNRGLKLIVEDLMLWEMEGLFTYYLDQCRAVNLNPSTIESWEPGDANKSDMVQ